jgi:hypothetical protein
MAMQSPFFSDLPHKVCGRKLSEKFDNLELLNFDDSVKS